MLEKTGYWVTWSLCSLWLGKHGETGTTNGHEKVERDLLHQDFIHRLSIPALSKRPLLNGWWNPRVAVQHALSAVKPVKLRSRLESDIEFSHHNLEKDFKGVLKHAVDLFNAFQLGDSGAWNDIAETPPNGGNWKRYNDKEIYRRHQDNSNDAKGLKKVMNPNQKLFVLGHHRKREASNTNLRIAKIARSLKRDLFSWNWHAKVP